MHMLLPHTIKAWYLSSAPSLPEHTVYAVRLIIQLLGNSQLAYRRKEIPGVSDYFYLFTHVSLYSQYACSVYLTHLGSMVGNTGGLQTCLALRLPLYVAITILLAQGSLAIPTLLQARNVTTNETERAGMFEPGWTSGPKTRGTMTLVFSCVITLFLCIWTTVQVNIEPENNTNTTLFRIFGVQEGIEQHRDWLVESLGQFLAKRMVRKLGWSCVTIIVPEAILAVAMYERRAAIRLTTAMKKTMPTTTVGGSGSKDSEDDDQWNMTLSYYTIMGGFCISNSNRIQNNTTKSEGSEANSSSINERSTLTPHGVLFLQQKGVNKWIKAKEVKDKSKANKLTKVIVFFQALWMIAQVISRTVDLLPVTLLELHTCVHTFCALVTYATWWDKPVDVDLATPVSVSSEIPDELRRAEKAQDEDIATLSPLGARMNPSATLPHEQALENSCSWTSSVMDGLTTGSDKATSIC
jgi:hypothetical protein